MSRGARLVLFAVSGSVFAGLFVWALTGLPSFGDFQGEYGRILNSVAGSERHVTNVVAAVLPACGQCDVRGRGRPPTAPAQDSYDARTAQ